MTAPITPDERAAMRETVTLLRRILSPTRVERVYITQMPRLLDALDTAEAEVARLREAARPAPVWDEDTVRAEAIRAVESVPATTTFSWPHAVDVILAVVREHLPVSGESRATVQAEALRDAADAVTEIDGRRDDAAARWLRARADRLDPKETP